MPEPEIHPAIEPGDIGDPMTEPRPTFSKADYIAGLEGKEAEECTDCKDCKKCE